MWCCFEIDTHTHLLECLAFSCLVLSCLAWHGEAKKEKDVTLTFCAHRGRTSECQRLDEHFFATWKATCWKPLARLRSPNEARRSAFDERGTPFGVRRTWQTPAFYLCKFIFVLASHHTLELLSCSPPKRNDTRGRGAGGSTLNIVRALRHLRHRGELIGRVCLAAFN